MFTKQWDILYNNNGKKCTTQFYCIHKFSANINISLSDLNIFLSSILLLNIFPNTTEVKEHIKSLRGLRNSTFAHIANTRSTDDKQFEKKWVDVSFHILSIARHIDVSTYTNLCDRIADCRCINNESEVNTETLNQNFEKVKKENLEQVF